MGKKQLWPAPLPSAGEGAEKGSCGRVVLFEAECGRATNIILAPSAGCEGFARRSVTSVWARKAARGRRVPGSSLTIICCAGISCVGCRKLAYSHGSFMPQELKMVPMGTRDSALRVKMLPMGTRGKKKEPSTDDSQLFTKVALRSNV